LPGALPAAIRVKAVPRVSVLVMSYWAPNAYRNCQSTAKATVRLASETGELS